jgi:hypothetical protein
VLPAEILLLAIVTAPSPTTTESPPFLIVNPWTVDLSSTATTGPGAALAASHTPVPSRIVVKAVCAGSNPSFSSVTPPTPVPGVTRTHSA